MKHPTPAEWLRVERLCLQSFTGGRLSEDEQAFLADVFKRAPEEYRRVTENVRGGERKRMKSL